MGLLSRIPRPSRLTHGRPLFLSIESRRRDTHGTRSHLVLIFQTMRTQVEGRHMLTRRVSHLNNGRCELWGCISYLRKGRHAIYGGISLLVKCLKKNANKKFYTGRLESCTMPVPVWTCAACSLRGVTCRIRCFQPSRHSDCRMFKIW
jgi:hypothetical protein